MNKIKCIFFIGTLVSLILLSPSTILYANAQEEEHDELELFISVKKIVLTKSVGYFSSGESEPFEFYIKNFNDQDIKGNELLLSDFTIEEEEARFSDSPLFINYQNVTMKPSGPLILGPNENQTFTLKISDQVKKEGTYKGELTVSGEHIKPTTIEVTLKVHENISELLWVTILGASVSGVFGLVLTFLEKKEEFERSISDDSGIISHINGHIREINKNRYHIKDEYWQYLSHTLKIKKKSIEKYRDRLALEPKAEAVEWFEKATQMLPERWYLDAKPSNKRDSFSEIKKPLEQSKFYLGLIKELHEISASPKVFHDLIDKKIKDCEAKLKHDESDKEELNHDEFDKKELEHRKKLFKTLSPMKSRLDAIQFLNKEIIILGELKRHHVKKKKMWMDKLQEDTKKLKKWFYFFSTWLVAIPTTMFVTDKFVQDPAWDVVIAFAIGFAIYRAQDIQKAFTKEVKTPKVADKSSTPDVQAPPAGHHNGDEHNP